MTSPQTETGGGWKAVIADMFEGAREAVIRFPVTAFCLLLLAADANLAIADILWIVDIGWHLSLGLLAAAMASLAANLWCEAREKPFGFALAVSIGAGLFAWLLIWYADRTLAWEFVILPALAGIVVISPYVWKGSSGSFWLYGVRLIFAVFLGGLALVLGAGGISAIFASLEYLFGVDIPSDYYMYLWSTTGLLLAPLFGLGRLPRRYDEQVVADDRQYMSIGMRALGDFVAAPLLIVYSLILHAYAAKILVTGEVPKNQIGWLVLGYGFCVFGSLLFTAPFWALARAPLRLLLRIWPFVMPVPLAMLFYAVYLRIGQYGVTPERYLLAMYGVVAALIVLVQFLKPLRGDIRLIAIIPVAALCLASFGPQGVIGLSISSQANRFLALMENKPVDAATEAQAVSALRFLARYNGLAAVKPDGVTLGEKTRWRQYDSENLKLVAEAYGLNPDAYADYGSNLAFYRYYQMDRAVDSVWFDLIQPQVHLYDSLPGNAIRVIKLPGGEIEMSLFNNDVSMKWKEQQYNFSISDARILELADADTGELQQIDLESGSKKMRFLLTNLNGERRPTPKITNLSFALLLRSEDWP